MRRIVVHVGAHKTGTTSLQRFLDLHRDRLAELGIAVYRGRYLPGNHVELHVAAMRVDRISPFKATEGLSGGRQFTDEVAASLRHFAETVPQACLVFSAEGLSYLRYADEMERLRDILPAGEVEIVYYVRNPADFLASYRAQQKKWDGLPVNVSDESWMVDFNARISAFRQWFPRVTVLDYDRELREVGNVIPSFLDVLGVRDAFSEKAWRKLFLNRTP